MFRTGNVKAYLPVWRSLTSHKDLLSTGSGLKMKIPKDAQSTLLALITPALS